jgi:hypothetical protein
MSDTHLEILIPFKTIPHKLDVEGAVCCPSSPLQELGSVSDLENEVQS